MAGRRLKVLQLVPALEQGGVERGTIEIAQGLYEAGHHAMVISAGGQLLQELKAAGGEHWSWPIGRKSPLGLALVPRLRHFLQTQRVDIVHARSRVPAWIAVLTLAGMGREQRPRLVTTIHGFNRVGLYSSVMTRGEKVIAVSESIGRYVLSNYPALRPERLVVIPRGVSTDRYYPGFRAPVAWREAFRQQLRLASDVRLLLLAGRITRLKGHIDLLKLTRALLDEGRRVHALIVGAPDPRHSRYATELQKLSRALDLVEHVSWLGGRSDLREIMSVSDLLLSLSNKPESFGRTTLEALSLGRPVVGFAEGGVGELLDALYPPGRVTNHDFAALVRCVTQNLDAPGTVLRNTEFTLETMIGRTLGLYEQLVREPSSGNLNGR